MDIRAHILTRLAGWHCFIQYMGHYCSYDNEKSDVVLPKPHWPPAVGSLGPQNYGTPLPSQFRPAVPPQGQHFVPAASQQFRPVGQVPSSNVGMPAVQNQQMQFSQPLQQFPPRPNQPGLSTPSPQPIQVPYGQTNRPLTSASPQSHQTAPPLNNHMPGLGAPGMPPASSYSFTPSSFGQPPNNVNVSSQFQPISQVHAPVAPVAGQPWMSSGNQSVPLTTAVQQTSQQPPLISSADSVASVPSLTPQSASDWQEHTAADGRRYYYNKKTRQSSWEKPLELMTPIEMSWQVWRNLTTALNGHFEGGPSLSQGRQQFAFYILFIMWG
ncbi:hypothetical protein COLO4_28463 [Corchorus olitorius]|uniref:WW domain-containing protein n=1 Tax=Corchorus olitorius TaxID=93759 RepID=A0A1R3HKP7_9ROSI|nr:hypothetical protein COLO4_28463 [Corchorus olitorius]